MVGALDLRSFYEDSGFFSAAIAYGYLRLDGKNRIERIRTNLDTLRRYHDKIPPSVDELFNRYYVLASNNPTFLEENSYITNNDKTDPSKLWLLNCRLKDVKKDDAGTVAQQLDQIKLDMFALGHYAAAEAFIGPPNVEIARNVFGRPMSTYKFFNEAAHPSNFSDGDIQEIYTKVLTKLLETQDTSGKTERIYCSDDKALMAKYIQFENEVRSALLKDFVCKEAHEAYTTSTNVIPRIKPIDKCSPSVI